MKHKKKILIFNWMIVCLSVLLVAQSIVCVLLRAFSSGDKRMSLDVSAVSEITFNKTGLLDLIEDNLSYVPTKPLTFDTQEDVLNIYDKYISTYYETGLVSSYEYMISAGTGTLNGLKGTFYYITEDNTYIKDGVYESICVASEIPNAAGEFGRYSDNYVRRTVWNDNTCEIEEIAGQDEVATYVKDENGHYKTRVVNSQYNTSISYEKTMDNYFSYVLTKETIDSCVIDNSSMFTCTATFQLNSRALTDYIVDISSFAKMKKPAEFTQYQIQVVFNKYTGDIIQINKTEKYKVYTIINVDMSKSSTIVFKKKDN